MSPKPYPIFWDFFNLVFGVFREGTGHLGLSLLEAKSQNPHPLFHPQSTQYPEQFYMGYQLSGTYLSGPV